MSETKAESNFTKKLALTGAEISVNKLPAGACVPFVHSHKNIYTKGVAQKLQMSFLGSPNILP